jgi:diamine N-acetyltransferase
MEEQKSKPSPESKVTLREITEDTVRNICNLSVTEKQNNFVASNAVSIAQAYFNKYAWFRAIYADEEPVGFIMLYDDSDKTEYFLWRLMTDARYQGMGFGRRAMELLIEYVRTRPNATELMTSCVPGDGSPLGFYEKMGFKLTGEKEDEEVLLRLVL